MKELDIQESILEFLQLNAVFAWPNPSAGYFDVKQNRFRKHVGDYHINGVSDILGVIDKRPLAIEVKTPKTIKYFYKSYQELEKLEREASSVSSAKKAKHAIDQKLFLDNIVREGGVAFFADSIDDVISKLDSFGYSVS